MLANAMVALRIARYHWKALAIGAVILTLGVMLLAAKSDARHWQKRYEGEKAAHAATKLHVRVAAAQARADAEAAARKREARDAQIQQEKSREYEARIADARAALARFVRAKSLEGHARSPGVSVSPEPTGAAPSAAGEAVLVDVADLDRCNTAVVKAEAWLSWWQSVSK